MDNRSYFYISGIISISLFILIVISILYMVSIASKINLFALNKDNFISISLNEIDVSSLQSTTQDSVIVEQQNIPKEAKDIDIGDLFSDVWTKKIDIKKEIKKTDNKRLELIQKKIKRSEKKSVKELFENMQNENTIVSDMKSQKSSSSNEVNEYLAKIQATVYKYFRPPENSQGYSVVAVIELNALGKVLDFRILSYSANKALNTECDDLKQRLQDVLFPKNPHNESFRGRILLISQQK